MTILLTIFWFHWADINTILWILLASLADWCSDYTSWFLSPCPKLWHKYLWIMSWWSLPNLWEMVFVFQDSSSVGNFWLSKRRKDLAGTELCHSTFVVFPALWYCLLNHVSKLTFCIFLFSRRSGMSKRSLQCFWMPFSHFFHFVRIYIWFIVKNNISVFTSLCYKYLYLLQHVIYLMHLWSWFL